MRTTSASKTITRDPSWLGPAIPPGELLLEEYLKPLGVGQLEAARRLGISLNRLNEIVLGSAASRRTLRYGWDVYSRPRRSCGCGCRLIGICTKRCSARPARLPNIMSVTILVG
jgi:hypothetical protein